MDIQKLKQHIKLCVKNLKSNRVKCCGNCPFEDDILRVYPSLWTAFARKRELIHGHIVDQDLINAITEDAHHDRSQKHVVKCSKHSR
jgi:hypothetical protein